MDLDVFFGQNISVLSSFLYVFVCAGVQCVNRSVLLASVLHWCIVVDVSNKYVGICYCANRFFLGSGTISCNVGTDRSTITFYGTITWPQSNSEADQWSDFWGIII